MLPDDPQELAQFCHVAFETIARPGKELAWYKRQAFGPKADAVPPAPSSLAQDLFASEPAPVAAKALPAPATETITYERKKPGHGRKAFPAHLPRVVEVVEPNGQERTCSCCGGTEEKIGEDTCEVLEHIPQKLFVRRIVRPRYACPMHAEEGVSQGWKWAGFRWESYGYLCGPVSRVGRILAGRCRTRGPFGRRQGGCSP
jgi:hypothetical protein